jgi:hypothetical protein
MNELTGDGEGRGPVFFLRADAPVELEHLAALLVGFRNPQQFRPRFTWTPQLQPADGSVPVVEVRGLQLIHSPISLLPVRRKASDITRSGQFSC